MSGEENSLDHPFWRYSLSVYSKEGVPAELIALQDMFDIDVNIALFCLWLGRSAGLQLSQEQLDSICARSASWNTETVVPMRGVRRYLKTGTAAKAVAQRAAELRTQVKRLELLAEQIEQAILYDWYSDQRIRGTEGARAFAEQNLTLFMLKFAPDWNADKTVSAFATTLKAADETESGTIDKSKP